MGLIREPKGVDFFVVNKGLTEKESNEISAFIEEYKKKKALAASKKRRKAA